MNEGLLLNKQVPITGMDIHSNSLMLFKTLDVNNPLFGGNQSSVYKIREV